MKKKKPELKITYKYIKPKTKEETEEAERRLIAAYDILFDETERRIAHEGKVRQSKEESKP